MTFTVDIHHHLIPDFYRAATEHDGQSVGFAPGSRTFWHRHCGGLMLIGCAGSGLVVTREAAQAIADGIVVHAFAGEVHWHGASSGSPGKGTCTSPGCVGDIDGMLAISGCGSALVVGELHRLAPSSSTARIF